MTVPNPLSHVEILDCTLRDGGYYTAWDFEDSIVDSYLRAMARLPIRTVELGYANKPKSGYYGKYNFLLAGTTMSAKSRLRADQQLALMFDEKSIAPADVRTLLAPHVGTVDFVRIAVAPARADRALSLADEIRSLGIKVGINVMYLSDYWDDIDNSAWVKSIEGRVDSLALVDSYGACLPRQVATAVEGVLERVGSTPVGFHGHDNLGLALANSLAAAETGASIVDGTVTGMGRGPGNTRTELLLVHKAKGELDSLDHVAIESVTEQFQTLQAEHGWGTNLVYMISGAAGLPQNDVMDWLGKNRYSISAIVDALQGHANTSLDAEAYPPLQSPEQSANEVVIVGGGKSVQRHQAALIDLVSRQDLPVIHANYRHLTLLDSFNGPQIVCAAGDAADRLPGPNMLARASAVVVPEGPRFRGLGSVDPATVRQVKPFVPGNAVEQLGPVSDIGPLALALGAAVAIGAKSVLLVGFDGYANASAAEQELAAEVQSLIDAFRSRYPEVEISSGTHTRYSIPIESLYSRLAQEELYA